MSVTALWMRCEAAATERRAPIAPADARSLVAAGIAVTVERSPQRVFDTAEYAAAGCDIVEPGTWPSAAPETVVVGLKVPDGSSRALRHRHVFFGHAYKGQRDAHVLLRRFAEGGGILLDLECLTDDTGRRVAAFGFWAGYVGAALGVLQARGRLRGPLRAMHRTELDAMVAHASPDPMRVLVVGALGRCGGGARAALAVAGITPTCWDVDETRRLDRSAILAHDLLVNGVLVTEPGEALLRPGDLDDRARRLSLISDVTCDVTSDCNLLPVYDRPTDWAEPVRRLRAAPPLDLIAIDNLPSLLPREASAAFSADLRPHLLTLTGWTPVWQRALDRFEAVAAEPTAMNTGT